MNNGKASLRLSGGYLVIDKDDVHSPDDDDLRLVLSAIEGNLKDGYVGRAFNVNDMTVTLDSDEVNQYPVRAWIRAQEALEKALGGTNQPVTPKKTARRRRKAKA